MQEPPVVSEPSNGTGLYFGYAQRLAAVLAAVGVLATLALILLFEPSVARVLTHAPPLSFMLFGVPTIGGITAAIVLVLGGNPRIIGQSYASQSSTRIARMVDILWWLCGTIPLLVYVLLMIVQPRTLDPSLEPTLFSLLTSYWMAATAVSVALFTFSGRLIFFGVVLALLLTLPVRFDVPTSYEYTVFVLYRVTFTLPILVAVSWLLARSKRLDEVRAERRSSEASLVVERTAVTARRRTNEFVHDHVLSVLTAFSMYRTNTRELQRAAQNANEVMRGRLAGEPIETAGDLASVLTRHHPFIYVTCPQKFAGFEIGPASTALYAAAMEAISNAVRHGGPEPGQVPRIEVKFDVTGDVLHVRIWDFGKGFDGSESTESGRFGIEHGIHERMEEARGRATVVSAPGHGTVVTLIWPALAGDPEVEVSAQSRSRWRTSLDASMSSGGARTLVGVLGTTYVVVILLERAAFSSLVPSLLALALYLVVDFALLMKKWPLDRMPAWAAWVVAVAIGIGNYVALASVADYAHIHEAAWTLGAGALMACGLLVRKHMGVAWASVLILFVSTLAWAHFYLQPWQLALQMIIGQVVTLAFWTVMVLWASMGVYELTLADRMEAQATAEREVNEGVRKAVTESLRSVSRRAAPLIDPVAAGDDLTEEMRVEARILEASLRDDIRAASFVETPVEAAATDARRRGVDVVLLDDSVEGSVPTKVPKAFIDEAVRVLSQTESGRVVVRLQPVSASVVGTIVSPTERIEVAQKDPEPNPD